MDDFLVYFIVDGIEYHFNAKDVVRNMADGVGNPIMYVKCFDDFGNYSGVANLSGSWKICSFFKK